MTTAESTIDTKVRAYTARLSQERPDLSPYEREQLVTAERRRLIQDDPGVKALLADQARRKAETEAAATARQREADERRTTAARADLDREMAGIRAAFLANGGTSAEWEGREAAIRGDLLEERARRTAQAGHTAMQQQVRANF